MRKAIRAVVITLLAAPTVRADEARLTSPAVACTDSSEHPDECDDDDDSRLLLAPTGRPPRKGSGYVSGQYADGSFRVHGVFGWGAGATYGLTDSISMSGGVSQGPGYGQAYVASRIGKRFSERIALSAGLSHARAPYAGSSQTFGYVVGTVGGPGASVTAGAGVFRNVSNYSDYRRDHAPVVFFGGQTRLSSRVALVSENWLVFAESGRKLRSPLVPMGLSLRVTGDAFTADLGLVALGAFGRGGRVLGVRP